MFTHHHLLRCLLRTGSYTYHFGRVFNTISSTMRGAQLSKINLWIRNALVCSGIHTPAHSHVHCTCMYMSETCTYTLLSYVCLDILRFAPTQSHAHPHLYGYPTIAHTLWHTQIHMDTRVYTMWQWSLSRIILFAHVSSFNPKKTLCLSAFHYTSWKNTVKLKWTLGLGVVRSIQNINMTYR